MALLSLRNVTLAFGGAPLLDGASLQVERGERICLLGRNGAGKSSLLALVADELAPDAGIIDRQQGLRTASLPQDVPQELQGAVFEVVAGGLGTPGEALCRYHALSRQLETSGDQSLLPELLDVQHALDAAGSWPLQQRIEQMLTRLKL
jgi:ATP-binding cassette subfamily F protein uup